MEEIRIKIAKNGYTVSVDDEVYVAPTAWSLSELIRILIDKEYTPDKERVKQRNSKKQKL